MNKVLKQVFFLWMIVISANVIHSQNTFYYNLYKQWSPELENKGNSGSDAIATVSLGSCYDRGAGIQQDRQKAFKLFEKAYEMNEDPMKFGAYNLSLYYARGYVTPIDNAKAVKLLQEVIDNDNKFAPAYITIAPIYEEGGYGIEKNAEKAFHYWKKLADLDDAIGQLKTGGYYNEGKGVAHNIQKAEEYLKKSADKGNEYAMYELAKLYIDQKKYDEAINLLEKSGKKGFNVAYHCLGDMYYNGNGVIQSLEKAYEYFNKGIGFSACKFRVALMLRNGVGIPKDEKKANEYLILSANEGMDRAQYLLGCDYYSRKYEQNYKLAVKYLEMALGNGKNLPEYIKGDICRKLSACYRFGRGVDSNENKANEYNKKGAELGDADSKKIQEWLIALEK